MQTFTLETANTTPIIGHYLEWEKGSVIRGRILVPAGMTADQQQTFVDTLRQNFTGPTVDDRIAATVHIHKDLGTDVTVKFLRRLADEIEKGSFTKTLLEQGTTPTLPEGWNTILVGLYRDACRMNSDPTKAVLTEESSRMHHHTLRLTTIFAALESAGLTQRSITRADEFSLTHRGVSVAVAIGK